MTKFQKPEAARPCPAFTPSARRPWPWRKPRSSDKAANWELEPKKPHVYENSSDFIHSRRLGPATGLRDYLFFEDDFESAETPTNPGSDQLLGNGMVVGANVFDPTNAYIYNYFTFPAPNNAYGVTMDVSAGGFCNIATGEGGIAQGDQVLTVYNDYNNADHAKGGETSEGSGIYTGGNLIDANVFVEYDVEEADLGTTVTFVFDAKIGNFQAGDVLGTDVSEEGAPPEPFQSEAEAFLKVLDPDNDFQPYPNIQVLDTGKLPDTWGTFTLSLVIDPTWTGKLLQAGFRSKTSNYTPTGVFYDNISLTSNRVDPVEIAPKIISTSWVNGEFFVTFKSKEGFSYNLLKSENVEGPYDYDNPVDFIDGDGSDLEIFDDAADSPRAFYILDEQPNP